MDYETKADPLEAVFEGQAAAVAPVRPALSGATAISDPTRRAFVDGYLRRGQEVELKSFSGMVAADGGYAIPREIDEVIDATLKSISPIRAIANVVRVGSAGYRKLVTQNGVASGWAAETAARPETATPSFNEIVPSFGDLYANPAATQAMLDDAQFDVEDWLAGEIASEFAKAEGSAFVTGNGTDKPKGFLQSPVAATGDAVRPFGTLEYVASGAAGGFAASNPENRLIELVHALRAPYRQGAVWVMNSKTLATIRKFKTSDGAFIWQPGLTAGQPDTLLGYPEDKQHYFVGFVRSAAGKTQWRVIEAAATASRAAQRFVWALPQVVRDGFTHFELTEEAEVQAFDDVIFPLEIGREATVTTEFSTHVVTSMSGHERRNSDWADARQSYDVGPGVTSEKAVGTLLAFFRARRGSAVGFRFTDPFDHSSNGMTDEPSMFDQLIGEGDGVRTAFPFVKSYDDAQIRHITRPRPDSVRIAVDGEATEGWSLMEGGMIVFENAPASGAVVTAGFLFDVPVRFAEDRLEVSRATFGAGDIPSVPLIEIREVA